MLRTSSGSSPGVSRIAVFPRTPACRGDRAETGQADVALADVPVAVLVAAQRNLGVVEVEHHDAVEADLALDQIEEAVHAVERVDRIAGRPRVRGVQTDRQLRDDRSCAPARRVPRSCRRTAAPRRPSSPSPGRRRARYPPAPLSSSATTCANPSLRSRLPYEPEMRVDERHAGRGRELQIERQQAHRSGRDLRILAGEVDQVRGVDRRGGDARRRAARAELLQRRRVDLADAIRLRDSPLKNCSDVQPSRCAYATASSYPAPTRTWSPKFTVVRS